MDYRIEEFTCDFVNEPNINYYGDPVNDLTYSIIGSAMEVHNTIGKGFLEAVYKDCLSIEFYTRNINFEKEKRYEIIYKGIKIPHHYYADFIVENQVIVEVKAQNNVIDENIKQLINYLAASKCQIGLLINFGENSLKYKRVVLS